VGELLGRGNFTSVYRATEIATGRHCALKVVDRYRCDRLKKTNDLYMEKHCLQRTNHPNIVKMLAHFTDTLTVYVVLEECLGGELWEVVKTVGCTVSLAKHYLAQVVSAVEYLRQARIVHRDLKAENIMLTATQVVKLIDFGTAKDLENPHIKGSGNTSRRKVFEDYVGTPQFMPPEVIENKCTDFRSDTWSLGCTIFQVLAGVPPFHAASEYLIFTRIMDLDLKFPPGVDLEAQDMIARMVLKDADKRLGCNDIEEIKSHRFFDGVQFKEAHLKSPPVPTLVELCLQRIGRQLPKFGEALTRVESLGGVTDATLQVLERMRTAQKWQDDVLPPEEC